MRFPRNPALVLASAALVFSAQAVADHNSKNGEGWANMPNDIHNTRIDTRASGDNEAFKDFVQYGNGADSVNRFDDGEGGGARQMKQAGPASSAVVDQGRQQARDQQKDQVQDRAQDRTREHQATATADGEKLRTRQQLETRQSNQVRQSVGTGGGNRSQSGNRQGGGRGH